MFLKRLFILVSIFALCLTPSTCFGVDVRNDEAIGSRRIFDVVEITSAPINFPYVQGYSYKEAWNDDDGNLMIKNERYLSFPKGTTLTIKPKKGWEKCIFSAHLDRFEKTSAEKMEVYRIEGWDDPNFPETIPHSRYYLHIDRINENGEGKFVKDGGWGDDVLGEGIRITLPEDADYIYDLIINLYHPDEEDVSAMNAKHPQMGMRFKIDEDAPVVGSYLDVKKYHYYYAPVKWAVEKRMLPEDATELHANEDAPRSEVVEYIWKAKGSPEPKGENPFTDVSQSDDFYPAAVWAYENGITTGTTSTTFDPEGTCTRAQIVTFLWRLNSNQETTVPTTKFSDVNESDYFSQAVSWAVEKEITTGMTPTTFSPDTHCTRAQILTFLWRGSEDKDDGII